MSRGPDTRREPAITSIESTLPPTSPEELLASRGSSVLVFSHDAALASVIKRAADGRYPLRVINEWQDLIRLIKTDVGRIVVLDVDALTRPVEKALGELNQCAEWLVIIIAAKQNEAHDFMRFWSERRIHRLLIKPAALGITRLLLESAIARHLELHELHEETDSLEIPPGLRDYDMPGSSRWRLPAVVVLALAGAAAGLYLIGVGPFADDAPERTGASSFAVTPPAAGSGTDGDTSAMRGAPPPAETDASSRPDEIDLQARAEETASTGAAPLELVAEPVVEDPYSELLAAADVAELGGRLVEPRGDNALDHYVAILAKAPQHPAARAGLDALLERLYMRAEAQFLDGDLDATERTLGHIRRADPASSRLRFLSEQLTLARQNASALAAAEAAAAAAEAQAAAARAVPQETPPREPVTNAAPSPANPELASMLTLVERRLAQGQLVRPAGDSATDYLQRALKLDPADDDVAAAVARIVPALVPAARVALGGGDIEQAQALVAAAAALGAGIDTLGPLRNAIEAARAEQESTQIAAVLDQATRAIAQGQLVGGDAAAVSLLAQLRTLTGVPASQIASIESALTAAMSTAARRAIAAGDFTRAESLVVGLGEAGLDGALATALRRDLDQARRQADYLAQPAQISELTLVRAVQPDYPREALARDITGWVELLFTVDQDGSTRDIVVTDADPRDMFDNAAVEAVGRYRFMPFERDGMVYQRRVRVRLRFVLQ